MIGIERRRFYSQETGNYHALDDLLNLPKDLLSYKLQDWTGSRSTEENYRESVRLVNEILKLNIEASQAKRVVEGMSVWVDEYYEERPALTKEEAVLEGSFLAFGNDGKGVPIVREERGGEEAAVGRLMKGQKRGVKKQATVAVSFSFDPVKRSSEDILRALFREKQDMPRLPGQAKPDKVPSQRISQNVHRRAFLNDQRGAIQYAVKNLVRRNEEKDKRIVALVDCGIGLEEGIVQAIKEQGLQDNLDAIIADVVHVSEYVWDAANVIVGEKFAGRTEWVRGVMKDILESKTERVIKDLTDNRDKTNLTQSQQLQLNKVIIYLTNHNHKMDYKTYLSKGYPISTGLIESTCGHLVKDRMEQSGMRWTVDGAQGMLNLRAVKKNADWADFMGFVQRRLKPDKIKIRA